MVSKENGAALHYFKLIIQSKLDNNTELLAEHEARPPVRYNFTQFPFHNNPQKYITF